MPGTTNLWLAIIAFVGVAELVMLTGFAIVGIRLYREGKRVLAEIEARHVAPLATRLNAALDDVHEVTGRIRRVDQDVRQTATDVHHAVDRATRSLRLYLLPALGVLQGVMAAVAMLRQPSRHARHRLASSSQNLEEARFVSEGGHERDSRLPE